MLQTLPLAAGEVTHEQNRAQWKRWQEGLTRPITLPQELPRLRMLLVLDNLAGHRTAEFVLWFFAHGIMPLYTPLSGSWLNMAESIQRILKQRALAGTHPKTPEEIIEWLEAAARGWNRDPTPFEWGGKRKERRARSRIRRQKIGGSYAFTRRSMRTSKTLLQKWQRLNHMTH
ncbi:MAG: transposase [Rhodothermales bacterium]